MDVRGRKVLLLGDSLSAAAWSPGGRLATLLRADGATVTVNAVVGRSSTSLFREVPALPPLAAGGYDLVLVFLGTNDLPSFSPAASAAAFGKIAAAFPTATLVAIGPPAFPGRRDLDVNVDGVYTVLRDVFGSTNVVDARSASAGIRRTSDGVHFTAAGAVPFAERLHRQLVPPAPRVSAFTAIGGWRWSMVGLAGAAAIAGVAWAVRRRQRAGVGAPAAGRAWMSERGERRVVDEIDTPRGRRLVIHSVDGLPQLLPPEDLEQEIRLDESRAARAARVAAERQPPKADDTQVRAFSSNPKIRAALLQVQGFNGEPLPRYVYIERAIAAGARVEDARGGRRLVQPSGGFFTERDITKSAMDYAAWLGSRGGLGAVFYRGTVPGETRRIDEPFTAARGKLFVARRPESARAYGSRIEEVVIHDDAKILREEDPAFWRLIGRRRPPNGSIASAGRRGERVVDVVNEAIVKATAAGYDVLSFADDSTIGTVVLNSAVVVDRRQRGLGRERIPGGLAPGGRCPADADPQQIRRGIAVEREHTDSDAVAREIACDHLVEDPRYYAKLAKMESGR